MTTRFPSVAHNHPWIRPGIDAVYPALYSSQQDRVVRVVDVDAPTRQVWVRFPGSDDVRAISTFHLRPMPHD